MQESLFDIDEQTCQSMQGKPTRFPWWKAEAPQGDATQGCDLFGSRESHVEKFGSGASAKWDFLGYRFARLAVGVTATELSGTVEPYVLQYLSESGRVFVDSGAFGSFIANKALDFERQVFPLYDRLCERPEWASGLLMVMPDVVGDEAGTLALQQKHIERIKGWMRAGIEAIFPLQNPDGDAVAAYRKVVGMVEGAAHVVGVPSNAKAWSARKTIDFARDVQPARMHLLGLAKDRVVKQIAAEVARVSPRTVISCDSCQILAHAGCGRRLTDRTRTRLEAVVIDALAGSEADALKPLGLGLTSYLTDVLYTPGFLSGKAARDLAAALGYGSAEWGERFEKAALVGMSDVLGPLDPDEEWMHEALEKAVGTVLYRPWISRKLSGPIRAYEVARMALGDDPEWVRLKAWIVEVRSGGFSTWKEGAERDHQKQEDEACCAM